MLKIRLMRIGAKKRPFYRVVVVDERQKRTGGYIESVGYYNPLTEPKDINLKQDRIDHWQKLGAKFSDGFLRILGKAPQKMARPPKKSKGAKEEQQKPEHSENSDKPESQNVSESESQNSDTPTPSDTPSPSESSEPKEAEGQQVSQSTPTEPTIEEPSKEEPTDK